MTTDIQMQTDAAAISPRRLFAMFLMVLSSLVISFGGLVQRSIEDADAWQINVYRSLAFLVAVFIILLFQSRRETLREIYSIGYAGVWAGVILAIAGLAFMQALQVLGFKGQCSWRRRGCCACSRINKQHLMRPAVDSVSAG